ncbi:hypothetical protein QYM36_005954, partial [Artemia franciscana]
MNQLSKTEQVLKEMRQYLIDILVLSEIRWTGNGLEKFSDGYVMAYSGHPSVHRAGVGLLMFYGTYLKSYIKFGTLKLEEDVIVKRELDEEYKQKAMRMNKDVAGIFLTPAQKVIVESDQPYLQIIGLPGTGKTYCLLLKMVQVFFELWEFRQKSYNSAKDIIIVIHRNDITVQFIKRMFWQTVEKQLERKQLKKKEEMTSLIQFIGGIPKFERKNFSPGTRVIGKTPQFVPVKDSKDLKNKVKELLKHLVEEEEIQRSEIAVIRSDVIYEDLLEEIG